MLTTILPSEQKAFSLAIEYHGTKTRKLSGFLYIVHLIFVHKVVTDIGLSENARVAAILHHMLDKTEYTAKQMQKDFGPEVLKIVQDLSENNNGISDIVKKQNWKETKSSALKKMEEFQMETLYIAFADKFANLVETNQFKPSVEKFGKVFHCTPEEMHWYFSFVYNVTSSRRKNMLSLMQEQIIAKYEMKYFSEMNLFEKNFIL